MHPVYIWTTLGLLNLTQKYPLSNLTGDNPEAFGQHSNAEIAAQMVESNSLLNTLIALQPRNIEAGAKSADEVFYSR